VAEAIAEAADYGYSEAFALEEPDYGYAEGIVEALEEPDYDDEAETFVIDPFYDGAVTIVDAAPALDYGVETVEDPYYWDGPVSMSELEIIPESE